MTTLQTGSATQPGAQNDGRPPTKPPQDPMPHNRYLPNDLSAVAALRLVTLPYAGGGAAPYYRWRKALDARIELVPLQLPGREGRIQEAALTELPTLVREVADAFEPVIDRPYSVLGHSLGATVAFELVRELRRRGMRKPELLVVAASAAPHADRITEPMRSLDDEAFVAEMSRRFDGIPSAVRENKELLAMLLPAMRADVTLLETYEYVKEPPLDVEILAIGGAEDRAVSRTELADWRRHNSTGFTQRMFPGGHFFLFAASDQKPTFVPPAVRTINDRLQRLLAD